MADTLLILQYDTEAYLPHTVMKTLIIIINWLNSVTIIMRSEHFLLGENKINHSNVTN